MADGAGAAQIARSRVGLSSKNWGIGRAKEGQEWVLHEWSVYKKIL